MKKHLIVIAVLGTCALFAGPHHGGNNGVRLAADIVHLVGEVIHLGTPTTTVVTTVPAPATYTYVVYNGVNVPYCNGYYFLNNAWTWRGCGPAPCPPPRIHPVPAAYRAPRPHPAPAPVAHRPATPPPHPRGIPAPAHHAHRR